MRRSATFLVTMLFVITACSGTSEGSPDMSDGATESEGAPLESIVASSQSEAVTYPEEGRDITVIVPFAPGGGLDAQFRMTQPYLEEELGATIQVLNLDGAGSQVGITEMASSESDGYTIGMISSPNYESTYLNPEREATYDDSSFQMVALHTIDPMFVAVRADSPYSTLQELVDAAAADPGTVTTAAQGVLSGQHLVAIEFGRVSGADFGIVQFDGGAAASAALLGGQVDVNFDVSTVIVPLVQAGEFRALAVLDTEPHPELPDVPTATSQGFDVSFATSRGYLVPAGTPTEIVEVLAAAFEAVANDPEFQAQMEELGPVIQYLGPDEYSAYRAETYDPIVQQGLDVISE